jgi:hypothetical protein
MRRIPLRLLVLCGVSLLFGRFTAGQSSQFSGQVTDQQGGVVPNAQVRAVNQENMIERKTTTNSEGNYVVPFVEPGKYKLFVQADGFATAASQELILNVGQAIVLNIQLKIGASTEVITVSSNTPVLNVQDASVGVVVDREFVENMPLNGRSFQSLIALAPGVVATNASGAGANVGTFNVNGQRSDSNTFYVDGVSGNAGVANPGQTAFQGIDVSGSGGASSTSANGGFNTLVSVDDVQEFKIQTSTYAPEFGRTPGGQFSIVTRSGTNSYHGNVFDYLRNTVFDANDWFAKQEGFPRAAEHQNDFGGVVGGPILKDNLFFFFSYEGLRLIQPQTGIQGEPDLCVRGKAPATGPTSCAALGISPAAATLLPFFNAFPIPQGPEQGGMSGLSQWVGNFSEPNSLDNTSIRIDYNPTTKINLFGRFNDAPSSQVRQDGGNNANISNHFRALTLGMTYTISPTIINDLRFNYSTSQGTDTGTLNTEGGAVPITDSYAFPTECNCNHTNAFLDMSIHNGGPGLRLGLNAVNPNHQINIVDTVSLAHGGHQFKFGVDYRRLTPSLVPRGYTINGDLFDPAVWATGNIDSLKVSASEAQEFAFTSLSLFAQDTWKITTRLTMTYGVRWEFNPPPSSPDGRLGWATTPLVEPFDSVETKPLGTPLYKTTWDNFAPRLGLAYQFSSNPRWERVLRAGAGIFYDTGFSASVNDLGPFTHTNLLHTAPFPLSGNAAVPPVLPMPNPMLLPFATVTPDPNLKLPLVYQFNTSLQQELGQDQSLTVTYAGALGHRLLVPEQFPVNSSSIDGADFGPLFAIRNDARSNYNALQVSFQRRLSHGFQALVPFTWAHSIDNASTSLNYFAANGNYTSPGFFTLNRGSSDFDIRFLFNPAVSYYFPTPQNNFFLKQVLGNWVTDGIYHYTSAPPNITDLLDGIDIVGNTVFDPVTGQSHFFRPNLVPGEPPYLTGAACQATYQVTIAAGPNAGQTINSPCPGGRRLNPAAFSLPPDPTMPGNLGRNQIRAYSLHQLDLTLRRDFPFAERFKLQFRVDAFNLFNHPNFASMVGNLGNLNPGDQGSVAALPTFGIATSMLGGALKNASGFNALYQVGQPRSFQFSLKLLF